jgi:hypothetical protein
MTSADRVMSNFEVVPGRTLIAPTTLIFFAVPNAFHRRELNG